jgi:tetratricopeptide (TPR) repeat protein
VLQRAEDFQGAKKAFRQAIDIHWAQAFSFPKVDVHAKELASVQNNLAVLYAETGEQAKALDLYREVCKTQERLAKKRPSDHELAIQLARTYSNLGNLLQQRNDPAAAREEFARALAIKEGLMRAYPEVGSYQEDVALGLKLLGDVTGVEGNFEEARRLFERAIDLQEDLIQRYPHVESYASELASQCTELGLLLLQHAPREARPALERACTNARRLLTAHPDSAQEASRLGGALNNLAILDLMERRFLDARRRLVEAVRLQKQALDAKPADPVFRQFLGNHYRELARAAHALADASLEAEANAGLAELTANNPALQVLDARLDAVKAGAAPRDHTERVELARRAYDRRLYALAARLWGEAIARDPEFAADRQAQHRYNAACAAALAAAGKDKEESTLDDGEKARLRHAAAWGLGEDLQAWAALLRSPSKGQVERVVVTLTHWQVDPDLAVIRDPAQLEALPESERRSLESLWHDVERTLARAFVMACDSRFPRDAFAR